MRNYLIIYTHFMNEKISICIECFQLICDNSKRNAVLSETPVRVLEKL